MPSRRHPRMHQWEQAFVPDPRYHQYDYQEPSMMHQPPPPHQAHHHPYQKPQHRHDLPDETYFSGESLSDDDYARRDRKIPHRHQTHSNHLLSPAPSYPRHPPNISTYPTRHRQSSLRDDSGSFIFPEKPIHVDISVLDNGYVVNHIRTSMGQMSIREMRRGIFKNPAFGVQPGARLMIDVHGEELDSTQFDPKDSVKSVLGPNRTLRGVIYQGHGYGRSGHRQGGMRSLQY
ncbi:uncharacterized protein BDZ99DRAFT_297475 [Mytilinidion resinicola]|uniref:Uncharacterized protein n=1 Tax=Mytilinidion resinicola TaxID=574789 RepID=A0A6A6YS32_9PEZI|nr:uncharacterized protein BDZ99DRAFT_297475 [Mytilinidion resinicola]KAF2811183.1 hypothetical protein BDZ99DRAFT_297475 [Mytilinidion resinicola]